MMPAGSNQLIQMTRMVRLKGPDKPPKDIVYLLIIKENVQRICSSPEDFYVFKFFIFYKNTFQVFIY